MQSEVVDQTFKPNINKPFSPIKAVIQLSKYLIVAFIAVHIFSVLGLFIAFAYPLAWFFIPDRVFCFYCIHQFYRKNIDPYCRSCKRRVETIYYPPFKSMVINTISLIAISLFCMIIVAGEVVIIDRYSNIIFNSSTTDFEDFGNNSYSILSDFYYNIEIKDISQSINLVKVDLSFTNEYFEVVEIDVSSSFATIFPIKEFSNNNGKITIMGGLSYPGFFEKRGLFAKIKFAPKKIGAGQIKFLESSRIYANDGNGTNILYQFRTVPIVIKP